MEDWEVLVTVWRRGEVQGTLRFSHSPITVGASSENDVVLADPEVSGSHGKLTVSRRRLAFHDHSTNGTFLGDSRIVETALEPEDRLRIPPFELRALLVKIPISRRTVLRSVAELRPRESPPGSPGLRVIRGPVDRVGSWIELPARAQCIGRSDHADLRFEVATLSRLHAVIQPEGDDRFSIQDLESSNGVVVNGQRTAVADLRPGDEIGLGRELLLRFESAAGTKRRDEELPPEPLAVERRQEEGILVVAPSGAIFGEDAAGRLVQQLDSAVEGDDLRVLVDLSGVTGVDAHGLGALAKVVDALDYLGGDLQLFGAEEGFRDTLSKSRLRVFFKGRLHRDSAAALDALHRPRGRRDDDGDAS